LLFELLLKLDLDHLEILWVRRQVKVVSLFVYLCYVSFLLHDYWKYFVQFIDWITVIRYCVSSFEENKEQSANFLMKCWLISYDQKTRGTNQLIGQQTKILWSVVGCPVIQIWQFEMIHDIFRWGEMHDGPWSKLY
jgi:hypothetical protein